MGDGVYTMTLTNKINIPHLLLEDASELSSDCSMCLSADTYADLPSETEDSTCYDVMVQPTPTPSPCCPSHPYIKDKLLREGIEPNPGPKTPAKKMIKKKTPPAAPRKIRQKNARPRTQVLTNLGTSLGSYFGPLGSKLGRLAGRALGTITGMGDYRVQSNSLMTDNGPPLFKNGKGVTTVVHREFVTNINATNAFTLTPFAINPGNKQLFPWLGNMAQNFEEYRFKGLVMEFKTTSGTSVGSTNTALGAIVMATDYNVNNVPFTSKQQMEAYEFCTSTVPCNSVIHPIECKPSRNVLSNYYVRHIEDTTPDIDKRFYDVGLFQVASVGSQATSVAGELWVSYEIEFLKPRLPALHSTSVGSNAIITGIYTVTPVNCVSAYANLVSDPVPTATWSQIWRHNPNAIYRISDTTNTLRFTNKGYYAVLTYVYCDTTPTWTSIPRMDPASYSGIAGINWMTSASATLSNGYAYISQTSQSMCIQTVSVTTDDNSFTFTGTVSGISSTSGHNIIVCGLPDLSAVHRFQESICDIASNERRIDKIENFLRSLNNSNAIECKSDGKTDTTSKGWFS